MNHDRDSVGFFGKIPGYGDFLSRGLPPSFIRPWDQWLRNGLGSVEQRLGRGWAERFTNEPALRFALTPGTCGPRFWLGVLVASRDKVGRGFPMTLALSPRDQLAWTHAIFRNGTWVVELEALARYAVTSGLGRIAFERSLARMELTMTGTTTGDGRPHAPIKCFDLGDDVELPSLSQELLDGNLLHFAGPLSLWWTEKQAHGVRYAHTGLPSEAVFLRLIPGLSLRTY